MSDILSQEEIDKLLKGIESGDVDTNDLKENDEKVVKDYDFARPSKFSKDHLRTLESMEGSCRLIFRPISEKPFRLR